MFRMDRVSRDDGRTLMKLNFARATALRVTPAIEAGLADHVWSIEQIVGLGQTA
jgi:hypothetical protein